MIFLLFQNQKLVRLQIMEHCASDQVPSQFSSRMFKHETKVQVHLLIQSSYLIVRTNVCNIVMKYV